MTEPGPSPNDVFWRSRGWWMRAGQTSFASWASTGLAFLATVAAARALGPSEFGAVVLAMSLTALISTFLDITLEQAVIYYGQESLTARQLGRLRSLIRTSLLLDVGVGLWVALVLVLVAAPLADIASNGRLDPDLVRLATLGMLASTANGTTGAMLMLAERTHLRAWIMAVTNLLRLVGVLVAVQVVGGAESVLLAFVVSSAAGAAIQAVVAWRLGWREWRHGSDAGDERVGFRALANFGIHTSVGTSLFSARDLLFPVVLGSLSGPAAVGLFRIAMFPVFLADTASGPVRLLLLPEQAKLVARRRYEDLRRSIRLHTLVASAIGIPAAAAGYFLLPWLIPLIFSDKFAAAVGPARILLVGALCHFIFSWGKSLPAALGRPQMWSFISAVSLVLTIGLLAVLGGSGSEGAAVAYSVAELITALTWVYLTYRVLLKQGPPRGSRIVRPDGANA